MTKQVEMETINYLANVPIVKSKGGKECVYRDFERAGAPELKNLNFYPGNSVRQKVFNFLDVNGFKSPTLTQLTVAVTHGSRLNKITSIAARNGLAIQAIRGVIDFMIKYQKESTHLLSVYFPDAAVPPVSKVFDNMPYQERQEILQKNIEGRLEEVPEEPKKADWEDVSPVPVPFPPGRGLLESEQYTAPEAQTEAVPVVTEYNKQCFASFEFDEQPCLLAGEEWDLIGLTQPTDMRVTLDPAIGLRTLSAKFSDGNIAHTLVEFQPATSAVHAPFGDPSTMRVEGRFGINVKVPGWANLDARVHMNVIGELNLEIGSCRMDMLLDTSNITVTNNGEVATTPDIIKAATDYINTVGVVEYAYQMRAFLNNPARGRWVHA